MLKNKKQEQSQNNILSLSRNLERPKLDTILSTKTRTQNSASKLKKILDVYESDSSIYISKAAAYSLGFINTRAIMLQDTNKLFQITKEQLEKIKHSDYELNIIKQKSNEQKKQGIQLFTSEDRMYISTSSAYAMGLIDAETFNSTTRNLYEINENIFNYINNKYSVEYEDLQKNSALKR